MTAAASTKDRVDPRRDDPRVEILLDLLAGALADYWSGEDGEDEASLTRTGPRTPPR